MEALTLNPKPMLRLSDVLEPAPQEKQRDLGFRVDEDPSIQSLVSSTRFRVWGSGFRIQGLGFRV